MKLTCLFLLMAISAQAQIVITEIQPAPAGDEPEWVEIENISAKAVTISDWFFCDERSCKPLPSARLAAGQRALLTKDLDGLRTTRSIPDGVRLIEITLPSLNNSTDVVMLMDTDSVIVDRLDYDLSDHDPPRSLERVGEEIDGTLQYRDLWASSLDRTGATPGRRNSTLILNDDIALVHALAEDDGLAVQVKNLGRTMAFDVPFDILAERSRRTQTIEVIEPGAAITLLIPMADLGWPEAWGAVDVTVSILRSDDRAENDTLSIKTHTPPPTGTISFNEIMFDPWPDGSDYVEFANNASDTIDVGGWIIEDDRGDRGSIPPDVRIPPGGLVVVSNSSAVQTLMDSGVPAVLSSSVNLNATGDRVVLRSADGYRVDEVEYQADWHLDVVSEVKGLSLEKRAPELISNSPGSWTTSAHPRGGTPGAPNSVSLEIDISSSISAAPSPFSSDRRHGAHPTVVSFTQPFRHAITRIDIRTPDGQPVRRLLDGALAGSEGAAIWDGRDENGRRVRPGPYVVILESVDAISSRSHHDTAVVVVGE